MAKIDSFERHHERYEDWFTRHEAAYHSELLALRAVVPWQGLGMEIGVGSGRFSSPLGVPVGLDPSGAMLGYAARRGIQVVRGVAEALPFLDAVFDYILLVTTICFVDDPVQMLAEARRVLRPQGALCVGFIDRETPLGQFYQAHQDENVFYRDATFYSASDVTALLQKGGFRHTVWAQTIFQPRGEITEIEPMRQGYGKGAFVVVRAERD